MKKFSYFLIGATGLVLASCANEDLVSNATNDGTATVTVNLRTPQIQTRDYSDGTTARKLQYAVYLDNGTQLSLMPNISNGDGEDFYLNTQKEFKLVTGKKYKLVFWAESANKDGKDTNPYNVTFAQDGVTMKIDPTNTGYTLKANDENLDAFYSCYPLEVKGDTQLDIPLYRPFAQLNIGTNDYTDASNAGYNPKESRIIIAKAHTTLDLVNGTVDNDPQTLTYNWNNLPSGEDFIVPGYDYLAMVYVLVPQTEVNIGNAAEEPELVTVAFDHREAATDATNQRQIGSVPLKRNYRTNLYGQILTSNAEVNIYIAPAYEDPDFKVDELVMAAAVGGTINLSGNYDINKDILFRKDGIINLNGNVLTLDKATISLATGEKSVSNVVINGPGSITKIGQDSQTSTAAIYVNNVNSTVTINGGNITSDGTESVYVQFGTAIINGGYFAAANTYNNNWFTLNCNDTNFRNGDANIIVYGGIFENFDPAHSKADHLEGETEANLVAPGYKSVPVTYNGKSCYAVVPVEAVVVNSEATILEALAAGKKYLFLEKQEYTFEPGNGGFYNEGNQRFSTDLTSDMVIDGNGATFKGSYSPNFHGATIKNIIFDANEADKPTFGSFNGKFENCQFLGGVNTESKDNESTFDNCQFICDPSKDKRMAFHIGLLNAGKVVTLNKCLIDGRVDMGATGTINFNNCSLNIKGDEWGLYGSGVFNFKDCTVLGGNKDNIKVKDNGTYNWN